MREIFLFITFIFLFVKSYGCGVLWFNHCESDEDCCSLYCWKGNEDWNEGVCKESGCELQVSKKLEIICISPLNETVSCGSILKENSRAIFRCKDPIYWQTKKPEYTEITCKRGRWNFPLVDDFCERDCGRSVSNIAQQVGESCDETKSFPWHASIYEFKGGKYELTCGGTLISSKTVISAAQCFAEDDLKEERTELKNSSIFRVAVGKKYAYINESEDTLAQIKQVDYVEIPQVYEASRSLFVGDIAFIFLKEKIEFSSAVLPICISFGEEKFEEKQLIGTTGEIVQIESNNQQSSREILKPVKMDFASQDECKDKVSNGSLSYLTKDKFCAKADLSGGQKLKLYCSDFLGIKPCHGLKGGGLVFLEATKKHFLRGVLSFGPAHCKHEGFMLFTKLLPYKKLLKKFSQDECDPVISKKLAIDCFTASNKPISCKQSMKTNSRASFRCNYPIYQQSSKPEYTTIFCRNGIWERPMLDDFCTLVKGSETRYRGFAWHASIYDRSEYSFGDLICGGTLISSKTVISAAQCFVNKERIKGRISLKDSKFFVVAVGKYVDTDDEEKDPLVQYKEVQVIKIPRQHYTSQSEGDIAFIVLKEEVKYSSAVLPMCVDFGEDSFTEKQLKNGAVGKIVGWHRELSDSGLQIDKLKSLEMTFVEEDECRAKFDDEIVSNLSSDKFCAETVGRLSPLRDASGGGFVFTEETTGKYFLRGVVNTKYVWPGYGVTFTDLSPHMELVERFSQEYGPPPPNCGYQFGPFEQDLISCSSHSECSSYYCEKERKSAYGFCKTNCGRPNSKVVEPVIRNGSELGLGNFPWHAGVYEFLPLENRYEQICGGSLISKKVVISAAHCFVKDNETERKHELKDSSLYKIAVGKHYRNINALDDKFAEVKNVSKIEIFPEYNGRRSFYEGDIAVVLLNEGVQYSWTVLPICIDFSGESFEGHQLVKGSIGKIVGWGYTSSKATTEELRFGEMSYVPKDECKKNVDDPSYVWVTKDKLCFKSENFQSITCSGDSGGGLVVFNAIKKRHYLRGIISLGPKDCSEEAEYAFFTDISSYKELIEKYM